VVKCIIYSQLRDLTIFFAQDQIFSKIHQFQNNFLTKTKKYVFYGFAGNSSWQNFPRTIHRSTISREKNKNSAR
jgi:hypothetical protein